LTRQSKNRLNRQFFHARQFLPGGLLINEVEILRLRRAGGAAAAKLQ
jgi:hypothetical protein